MQSFKTKTQLFNIKLFNTNFDGKNRVLEKLLYKLLDLL